MAEGFMLNFKDVSHFKNADICESVSTAESIFRQRIDSQDFEQKARALFIPGEDDRPCLLFLAGLGGTALPWFETALHLHKQFGCSSVLFSLPGHENPESIAEYLETDWTQFLIDAATELKNKTGKAPIVIAFSTGAAVAMKACIEKPELFHTLVSVAPPATFKLKRQESLLSLFNFVWKYFPGGKILLRKIRYPMPEDPPGCYPEKEKEIKATLSSLPLSSYTAMKRLRDDNLASIDNLRTPTLFLQGQKDKYLPPSEMQRLCDLAVNCEEKKAVLIAGAPHSPMQSPGHKEECLGAIKDWLKEVVPEFLKT